MGESEAREKRLLTLLKNDLSFMTSSKDEYLKTLLEMAKQSIQREGIMLADTTEDDGLQIMYAAYLFRKRALSENGMPRMLRYAMNVRLISQKAKTKNV